MHAIVLWIQKSLLIFYMYVLYICVHKYIHTYFHTQMCLCTPIHTHILRTRNLYKKWKPLT